MQLYYFKDKEECLLNPADGTTGERNDDCRFWVAEKLDEERKDEEDQVHDENPVVELLSFGLPDVIDDGSESNLVLNVEVVFVIETVDDFHELKLCELWIKFENHFVALWPNNFVDLNLRNHVIAIDYEMFD